MAKTYFKREIPFLRYRKLMLVVSAFLIVVSLLGIGLRGLNFGIEFQGGTSIDFTHTKEISVEEMRKALRDAGEDNPVVQSTMAQDSKGFLVRTSTTDPALATAHANQVAEKLGLEKDSYQVTTIGPDWGTDVSKSSLIAFIAAIGLIILYISFRFEFKMSLTAVASLLHDLIIICGVYAWTGHEVTPNVIAALLTIMGYSLYDTVVVFHRINENAKIGLDAQHKTFYQISNLSLNEVFMRTINTTITSLVPVLAMLFVGGETLKDFAFAMAIGLILGSYSSIGIATPLFAIWKTAESSWKKLERKYGEKAEKNSSNLSEA